MRTTNPLRSVLRTGRSAALIIAILAAGLLGGGHTTQAQTLDLLLDGGHVIDPKSGTDAVMDVGIAGDTIAVVAPEVSPGRAERVVDASGLYVTPGLIDLHVHVFRDKENSVKADAFTFRAGVTTAVDVGSVGWRDIDRFVEQTAGPAETRILAFLNIVGAGMKGGVIEQNLDDMNPRLTALAAEHHPEVVGVKLAHYQGRDWEPVDRAVEAGRQAGIPVMVDFGSASPPLYRRTVL